MQTPHRNNHWPAGRSSDAPEPLDKIPYMEVCWDWHGLFWKTSSRSNRFSATDEGQVDEVHTSFNDLDPREVAIRPVENRLFLCTDGKRHNYDDTHNIGVSTFQNDFHLWNAHSGHNVATKSYDGRDSLEADVRFRVVELSQSKNDHHQDNVLARPNIWKVPCRDNQGMNQDARPSVDVSDISPEDRSCKGWQTLWKNFRKTSFHKFSWKFNHTSRTVLTKEGRKNEGSTQKKPSPSWPSWKWRTDHSIEPRHCKCSQLSSWHQRSQVLVDLRHFYGVKKIWLVSKRETGFCNTLVIVWKEDTNAKKKNSLLLLLTQNMTARID